MGAKITKTIIKTCEQCGKQFEVLDRWDQRDKRFCSRSCSGKHCGRRRGDDLKGKPAWNRGLTKHTNESMARASKNISKANKGKKAWNAGLTKETSEAVLRNSISTKESIRKLCGSVDIKHVCPICGSVFYLTDTKRHNKIRCCCRKCSISYIAKRAATSTSTLERNMMSVLNEMDISFRTQYMVDLFPVDFYIEDYNLIIQVDGVYWHSKPSAQERDARCNEAIKQQGYKLLRFREDECNDIDFVINIIRKAIESETFFRTVCIRDYEDAWTKEGDDVSD
jgi:very-short-patch-repair endonuclease